jgi:hypothetical protein
MKIKVELSKSEIELAITKYIEQEYSKKVVKISFKVADVSNERYSGVDYQLVSSEIEIIGNIR